MGQVWCYIDGVKVRAKNLTKEQKIETLDALYTAAGSLNGRANMKMFLCDLLSESERVMLGRRIMIARKILAGDGYDQIQLDLKVGKTTVSKVHRWLSDQMPGYEQAIKGLEKELTKRKRKLAPIGTFTYLKKRYPLHFLLFPWPKD
ncbi:hypothetical protein A2841_03150 [Candidatus Kaiserbacteria bacterium RIFCSPHIGHO2_01_FULL_48_10]|uniref:TrpR like protein, YerC/YecD n=1 Tax=Candidatus Kaiserbacteria bacterium RIFCSPHIGHO2_01_FULL_48_10 TaxID=1798476 RepID=A0A1F6C1X5_9BACT|nr:MAG: hypothetical protein A2841_03150 [Candidatus Kaiserbacteria bacterium RIFCSPHIGHO2_01_FULL_48_10]